MARKHHLKKGLLFSLFAAMALIWLVFGITKHWISNSQNPGLSRRYDSDAFLGYESQRSMVFLDSSGHPYLLGCDSNIMFQYRLGIPIPIGWVDYAVPTDEGVAYKRYGFSKTLYIQQNLRKQKISGDYTDIAWDGTQILLLNKSTGEVYTYVDGVTEFLCQTEPQAVDLPCISFLTSDRWIVICGGEQRDGVLQIFDRQKKELKKLSIYADSDCVKFFLNSELLIIVGGYYQDNALTVIDLAADETHGFDLDITYGQEIPINASAVMSEDRSTLYISIAADPLPYLSYLETEAMTIAVNLNNYTYEKLNDIFYASMFLKNGDLYGIKNGFIVNISGQ